MKKFGCWPIALRSNLVADLDVATHYRGCREACSTGGSYGRGSGPATGCAGAVERLGHFGTLTSLSGPAAQSFDAQQRGGEAT
jgi:hypothetical protein